MTLLELRTQLRKDTGRHDLVDSDYANDGMDVKIRAASKYLDMTTEHRRSFATVKKDISATEYSVEIQGIRSVDLVHAYNSEGRIKLEMLTFQEMKTKYANTATNIDQGAPKYYCNSIINLAPDETQYATEAAFLVAVAATTADFTMDYDEIMWADHYDYSGLLIMPPADGTYTISVYGRFFSKALTSDTDKSYWSVVHPDLLMMAVQRQLEIDARNTEGVKDWNNAMLEYKLGVDFDSINTQTAIGNQMTG